MIKIDKLSYKDLFHEFGDPETKEGKEKIKSNLITVYFPFLMNNGKVETFFCNQYIAESVIDALQEIEEKVGLKFMQENNLDEYNGSYNHRQTRDRKWWSVHSWGAAIDFCAKIAGYGKPPMLPYFFVDAFLKRGFYWGGNWRYPDGMHFSVCNG